MRVTDIRTALSPFSRRLLLFSVCNALVLNVLLAIASFSAESAHLLPGQAAVTGVGATKSFSTFHQGTDSWAPMLQAVRLFREGHPIYDTLFFSLSTKFQYPVTALVPLVVLQKIGLNDDGILSLLNVTSWLAVWVTIGFGIAIFFTARPRSETSSRLDKIAVACAIVLAGVCFYPMMRGYLLGQIQVILNMLFAIALYCWLRDQEATAGALIGLMTLVKPQYAVILLWFLLRKRYNAFVAALSVAVFGLGISLMLFGWQEHLRYLDVLAYIAKTGESFYANLSVNGVVNRLMFNGPNLDWDAHAYAPYQPVVYAATLVSSILIIGTALWLNRNSRATGSAVDFAGIAVAATVASPVAWDHHYGVLFPIFAILAARLSDSRMAVALAIAYALVANSWSPMNLLARTPVLNLLQSVALFGVVLTFALCYRRVRAPGGMPIAVDTWTKTRTNS